METFFEVYKGNKQYMSTYYVLYVLWNSIPERINSPLFFTPLTPLNDGAIELPFVCPCFSFTFAFLKLWVY